MSRASRTRNFLVGTTFSRGSLAWLYFASRDEVGSITRQDLPRHATNLVASREKEGCRCLQFCSLKAPFLCASSTLLRSCDLTGALCCRSRSMEQVKQSMQCLMQPCTRVFVLSSERYSQHSSSLQHNYADDLGGHALQLSGRDSAAVL